MKVLCVAEKPSVAKGIMQILSGGQFQTRNSGHQYIRNYDFDYNLPAPLGPPRGGADFTVTAVLGHLTSSDFDDDHRKWGSCDPFALFDAQIITKVEGNMRQVETNLKNEARNADLLIIWTDCDREGEHIGWEVAQVCLKANRRIRVKRARFSAIIPAQIHQACRQANDLDQRQADAVETRIALDLRVGAAFTRLMTMALQARIPDVSEQVISYGPCQFPTLGFVVDQYNRVQAFIPETFWYIYVAINRADDDAESEGQEAEAQLVEFKWRRNHLFDMDAAIIIFEQCATEPLATVTKVETKPTTKWKPLPLTTVELQQSGSRLLHMAPKRVLDLAEKLYQKGFLSYPRTETDQYDKAFDFMSLIQKQTVDHTWGQFATKLVNGEFQTPRNGRKNDKAHPPIHPTAAALNLEADERRVYELVTRRFLASCHSNAEGKTTTVEADIAGEVFTASGLVVLRRNYLEVYPYDKWTGNALPDFQEGEQFMPDVCELKEGQTSRPNLLTEADLVGLMDKNGIGTDATIAEHIAKIIEREYVTEKQEARIKYLVPSLLGIGLVEGYNLIGFERSLSKPQLRAETEYKMQLICDGVRQKREVLDQSVEEYKEVFVKARREFETIIERVTHYLHGQGAEQDALRAAARGGRGGRGAARGARGAAGGRGGRGGGGGGAGGARNRRDDDDDDDEDDDGGGPGAGGAAARGRGRGAARAAPARGRGRGRGAAAAGDGPAPRRRPPPADDDDDQPGGGPGSTPACKCENDAVLRTATKSAANQGRQFWTCSKPQSDQCGFFEWADQAGSGNAAAGPSRQTNGGARQAAPAAKRQRTATNDGPPDNSRSSKAVVGSDGCLRCDCELEANSNFVGKEGANKGRKFWSCPNSVMARCKFFAWDDEVEGDPTNIAVPSRSGQGSRNGQRAAPTGGGGGGGATGECFKCGESGHWANACPNEGGPSRSGPAARGGGRSGPSGGGAGAGSSDECYKCHETGHWASACPNEDGGNSRSNGGGRGPGPGPRGGGGGGGGKSGECFKCGQAGHWSSDCPNEDGGGGGYGGGGGAKSSRGGRGGSRGRGGAGSRGGRGSRKKSW